MFELSLLAVFVSSLFIPSIVFQPGTEAQSSGKVLGMAFGFTITQGMFFCAALIVITPILALGYFANPGFAAVLMLAVLGVLVAVLMVSVIGLRYMEKQAGLSFRTSWAPYAACAALIAAEALTTYMWFLSQVAKTQNF